jgi:hypothetical protein
VGTSDETTYEMRRGTTCEYLISNISDNKSMGLITSAIKASEGTACWYEVPPYHPTRPNPENVPPTK